MIWVFPVVFMYYQTILKYVSIYLPSVFSINCIFPMLYKNNYENHSFCSVRELQLLYYI